MGDLAPILEDARRQLLDLGLRNRLLATPRRRARACTVEVVDERSDEIFRLLVGEGRALRFHARPGAGEEADADDLFAGLPPPADDETEAGGVANRHLDLWLQTPLPATRLQSRLLRLHYDSRSAYEERGVGVLHLAIGFLEWYESETSEEPHFAPLILVPVRLERRSALGGFQLTWAGEEITANVSLAERLRRDFGIELPELPDGEELRPSAHAAALAEAVADAPRFRVHGDDVVLGLFSFTRLLMWRDLDPASWPDETALEERPLLAPLLLEGFRHEPPALPSDRRLDDLLRPLDQVHVLDADSSQAIAIEEVRRGRNLVIQGPPGTGKSQTIANLIAAAVKGGQRVLFVAEKMAALEVVERRLDGLGLGAMCLELHSHKANKHEVIRELRRTFQLDPPDVAEPAGLAARLEAVRARLNRHTDALHGPIAPSGRTPYAVLGELVRLAGKGVGHAEITLGGAAAWSEAEIAAHAEIVADLAGTAARAGPPPANPWRGVGAASLLPGDRSRVLQQAQRVARALPDLGRAVAWLGRVLGSPEPASTPAEITRLLDSAEYLASAPDAIDPEALTAPAWTGRREEIALLGVAARTLAESRTELAGLFAAEVWTVDLAPVRRGLATFGSRWYRFLVPAYWRARRRLARLATAPLPETIAERIALLDHLIAARGARATLEAGDALGAEAFGRLWRGMRSDLPALVEVERWEGEGRDPGLLPDLPQRLARIEDSAKVGEVAEKTALVLQSREAAFAEVARALELDLEVALGSAGYGTLPLERLRAWLEAVIAAPEALDSWIAWRRAAERAREVGLGPLADALDRGDLAPEDAGDAFAVALNEALLRLAVDRRPELLEFEGESHDRLVERFRELDRQRIALARAEVVAAHHAGMARADGDEVGLALLRQEFAKRPNARSLLPIRKLLARAGAAVQALKPVFLMSPLSVAEFLAPGAVDFDLLLIDEASQVEPVDALGALARARRLVVVGDDRQLPPTRFFERLTGDDDLPTEDDPAAATRDLESILSLCIARRMPQRTLRWHYRSRHPSLIAVSNRAFYDDRLIIPPSPHADDPGLGLRFHHLPHTRYDRGGTRANRDEAEAVAGAVIAHASTTPHLSLGVGCFSIAQRDAILETLERRWREEAPEVRGFFDESRPDPFFVKNLETIQGDERDVVFVSVGYGRDAGGRLAMNFGPLSRDGGERRLNVLITRARCRLEVFSAITAADIDTERAGKPGVAAFKTFLQYAESGVLGLAERTGRGPDSPFEEAVARALSERGHIVDHQVGVAGFFVDLAVRDPDRPGRWRLGIECDGRAYHSALSARDRDRLRQQVLEQQGWIVHRIWSTDWYRRPQQELARAEAAIEAAGHTWAGRDRAAVRPEPPSDGPRRDRSGPRTPVAAEGGGAAPYVEAELELPERVEPHVLPAATMLDAVQRVVAIEGPVHAEEVARRITRAARFGRAGRRIVEAVRTGLEEARRQGRLAADGDFYTVAGAGPVPVRDRAAARSATLRRPDMLPPAEIRAAALAVAQTNGAEGADAIVTGVARRLGFQATSASLGAVIGREVERLIAERRLGPGASGVVELREERQRRAVGA